MLACPSSSLHGLAALQRHSQPSHFLLSKPLLFPPSSRFAASRKCNFRSLLSTARRRSRVRASAEVTDSVVGDGGVLEPYSVKIPVGDRHILVETGHIGRQANGSVTVTDGETSVFQQLVALVEGFLSEKERQKIMSPCTHTGWLCTSPLTSLEGTLQCWCSVTTCIALLKLKDKSQIPINKKKLKKYSWRLLFKSFEC